MLERVVFENGSVSLKHLSHGEAMHSKIGPWEEAHEVYLKQTRFLERATVAETSPLVIYDVGLGIGTNAIAAMASGFGRSLHVISFENDLAGARWALEHTEEFPFLGPWRAALGALTRNGEWRSPDGRIKWELKVGDFSEMELDLPAPEIVFFDFYSPKTHPNLWGLASFRKIAAAARPRSDQSLPTFLATYCAATAARVAMLLSGWHVGKGISTARKRHTTVACTIAGLHSYPLDRTWLEGLKNAGKPKPLDFEGGLDEIIERLSEHPQFRSCAR